MKTKFIAFTALVLISILMISCEKEIVLLEKTGNLDNSEVPENMKELSNVLLEFSETNEINEVLQSVKKSLEYGLDETMYINDISIPENSNVKLKILNKFNKFGNNGSLNISQLSDLEVYWPYSENWDGSSFPVIAIYTADSNLIDGDKIYAYHIDRNNSKIDSILIDEEYAKKHPVWIVRKSDYQIEDLIRIFNEQPTRNGIKISPRFTNYENVLYKQKVASNITSYIYDTQATRIKSEIQHDTWLNGGSEYVIYWFFPTKDFGLSSHQSEQICLSRSEISNKKYRNISFVCNYDWTFGQDHNKLKIIEFDPGNDYSFDVKFTSTYKPDSTNLTLNGEFKTTINLNKTDEHIMEETIARTSMFTTQTRISDYLYKKEFVKNGVTAEVSIELIEKLNP